MLQILTPFILFSIDLVQQMQPTLLTTSHTITHLRSMVESDADRNNILVCIDSLALQLKNSLKHEKDLLCQLCQVKAQNKKIKQKSKVMAKTVKEREKQYDNLKEQLKIRNAVCRKKSEQFLSVSDWTKSKESKSSTLQTQQVNQVVQCQFLNWQIFQEARQQNSHLSTKLLHLQVAYEDKCNQINIKQLYIEELLQRIQKQAVQQSAMMNLENLEESFKEQDNSTVDADELEQDDYQLPTLLQKTDSRDTQDSENLQSQIRETDCIDQVQSSWLEAIWYRSSQFYNFILRK